MQAFRRPMIGHRSQAFQELYGRIQPGLRKLFGTSRPVFLSTSSAWGVMEAAIRNLVAGRVLCCMCGAFSDKWADVARRCGREAGSLKVDWGSPVLPEQVDRKLASERYDAVALVHNETSTGVMNPLEEILSLRTRHPDTLFVVDAVSSLSAVPIGFDRLGIDLLLTGSQKALALPPGMSLFALSGRALERARRMEGRGYYFDFLEFERNGERNMTPSTPSIGHVHALECKLEEIFEEGLPARYARHRELAEATRQWALGQGFSLFAREGCRSETLTCVDNGARTGGRRVDVPELRRLVRQEGFEIDGGYGRIKGSTFRISSMGDETPDTMGRLFGALDKCLARL